MFSAAFLISYAEGLTDEAKAALRADIEAAGAALSGVYVIGDVIPIATQSPGDVMLEIAFADQAAWEAAKETAEWAALKAILDDPANVSLCDYAAFGEGPTNVTEPRNAFGHRLLFMHVVDDADPADIANWLEFTPHMQDYIEGFVNSRVCPTVESSGHNRWDYVFECDYTDPSIYYGPYLMHPIHVTFVDRYFEPAAKEFIMDPDLCTSVIATESAFLGNCL